MTRTSFAALVALVALVATTQRAFAQQPRQRPTANAPPAYDSGIEFQPKNPNDPVAFSFEDADLNELVRTVGELTGKRFIIGTTHAKGFKGTILSPQKITVAEAYQAFLATLSSNYMTVIPFGRYLKIVDTQDARTLPVPVVGAGEASPVEERFMTRVHRLAHVPAEEVATTILSKFQTKDGSVIPYGPGNLVIMTDTGTNIRRMMRLLEDIDVPSTRDKIFFEPIHHVASAVVEKYLSEILDLKSSRQGATAPGAQSTQPAGAADLHVAKIVAVDRPNALVIVATEASYRRLLALIEPIDVVSDAGGQMHVVALQHSDSKKLVGALNDAVNGISAASSAPRPQGGPGQPLGVFDGPVKISAEETTNSLIITSSPRDYASILEVLHKLDQPRRQVYIEAVVLDLSIDRTTSVGSNFHNASIDGSGNLVYTGFNAAASLTAPSITGTALQAAVFGVRGPTLPGSQALLGMSVPAVGAFMTALAVSRDTDVLSTPHILATDNLPAEIKVQLNAPLQTNAANISVPGANGTTSANPLTSLAYPQTQVPYGKIGPRIKVTPHLNESDDVRLDVEETISDMSDAPPQGTLGVVSYTERSATTTLTVRDQQTIVIGGLVRSKVERTETKIPILGDIPLLGLLFRSTSDVVQKSNLVLILTPYIIRDQEDLRRIFERKMQERQEFLDHYFVFKDGDYEMPKDYSRAKGLLSEIRTAYREVDQRREEEALLRGPEQKHHEPRAPIDTPAPPPALRTTPSAASDPLPRAPAAPPNINVAAPTRNLERIER